MLNWLAGKRRVKELPEYSALRSIPTRRLPPDLAQAEESEPYTTGCDNLERELREAPRRPADDAPLFTELIGATGSCVVTAVFDDRRYLLVFSTPFRAADYARTLLTSGPPVQYLSSSPLQLLQILHDLERQGIDALALDRCPRCSIFTSTGTSSLKTADSVITLWSIFRASQLARADLYFSYALGAARAGRLEVAREVALEMVGHVALEDPRPHFLLGQVAVRLRDRRLLREAKAFLRFLNADRWEQRLEQG